MVPDSGTGQIKTGGTEFLKPVVQVSASGAQIRPALGMEEGRAREGRGGCRDAYPVLSLREEGRRRKIEL